MQQSRRRLVAALTAMPVMGVACGVGFTTSNNNDDNGEIAAVKEIELWIHCIPTGRARAARSGPRNDYLVMVKEDGRCGPLELFKAGRDIRAEVFARYPSLPAYEGKTYHFYHFKAQMEDHGYQIMPGTNTEFWTEKIKVG